MILLTDRLKKAAEMIDTAGTLADIGCDHGYLPIYLAENNRIFCAYACDIKDGPLETAKKNILKYGFSDKIHIVKSDGLLNITDKDTDVISICGMGGRLIAKILAESAEYAKRAKKIVMQPMTEIYYLRSFLAENGFKIINEVLAREEDRFYNIICAVCGEEKKRDLFSLCFGGILMESNDPLLLPYLIKNYRILSANLKAKKGKEDTEELEYLTKKLEKAINLINFNENK